VTEFTHQDRALLCTGYLAGALTRLDDVTVLDVVTDEDGNATAALVVQMAGLNPVTLTVSSP